MTTELQSAADSGMGPFPVAVPFFLIGVPINGRRALPGTKLAQGISSSSIESAIYYLLRCGVHNVQVALEGRRDRV